MDNPLSDLVDTAFEQVEHTGKAVKRDLVKGVPLAAKQQIMGSDDSKPGEVNKNNKVNEDNKSNKKIDPVTGKPIPSKRALSDLKNATAQMAQMKLKKIREELEKQRMKITDEQRKKMEQGKTPGPEIPVEPEKPKEDVVAKVLKASKSTGEMGKNIGG